MTLFLLSALILNIISRGYMTQLYLRGKYEVSLGKVAFPFVTEVNTPVKFTHVKFHGEVNNRKCPKQTFCGLKVRQFSQVNPAQFWALHVQLT